MHREEILKRSRQENAGRRDEREMAACGVACRVGMLAGALVCAGLAFVGELVLHTPQIGLVGALVYCVMQSAGNIALFRELDDRRSLVWGVVGIALALACAVGLVAQGAA